MISYWAVFAENQVWLYQSSFDANFAGNFRRQMQILPANFARQSSPVNDFAESPPNMIWLSPLLPSFGLSCQRLEKHKRMPLGMVCVCARGGMRCEALWEGRWGRTLPWTSVSDCQKEKNPRPPP